MDMKKWINDVISCTQKKALPVLSFPVVQKMGLNVNDFISDADTQAKGMYELTRIVDSYASLSPMDLSVEAEAFGSEIIKGDWDVPTVTGSIIHTEEEADALRIPEIGTGRTGINIEAAGKAASMIDKPVLAGVIGPFSLAGRLMDVSETMIYCYDEPDMVHKVVRKMTDYLKAVILKYKEAGASGVIMAEPLTGILSPDLADEFSMPYVKEIVDAVQDDKFMFVYHNCGNNTPYMTDGIFGLGAMAYHFGNAADMQVMLEKSPKDAIVMGNVNPADILNGTPELVREETLKLLEKCSGYPNFVPSSGCDIPPKSPWENIDAFFDTVSEYYKR